MKIVGGKLMSVCSGCAKIIRLDKPILGSLHICTTDDERRIFASEIGRQYGAMKRYLESANG